MKKAIDFLYAHQVNGNWEVAQKRSPGDEASGANGRQWTGITAISIYALLCAGEEETDKRLSAAIDFLVGNPSEGVYASSCRCLVWSHLKLTPPLRAAAQKDVDLLLRSVKQKGDARGLLYYVPAVRADDQSYDNSTSQMGALGLSVMALEGFEIPQEFWFLTEKAWQAHQGADGGWQYGPPYPPETASMTAAGVATLFLTQSFLNNSTECRENVDDPHIDKGLSWLGTNFDATFDPGRELTGQHLEPYALFAISRVGVASGLRYFGNVDWYERGADYLIATQQPDGSWNASIPAAVAMDLLFLTYGSSPVVINKLQYTTVTETGKPAVGEWNQRPQDLLNFVDWMGRRLETRLNWQVVSLSSPVQGLHEAPILEISGAQALSFSDDDCARLRQFVEDGGMIVGNADCNRKAFSDSFIKLGKSLFPAYDFRELPATHPIYTNEQYHAAQFRRLPQVAGLSNGVREMMLLPAEDLSRAFQHRVDATHPDTYRLLADIVLYAMDTTGLERKGKTYFVTENSAAPIQRTIKLARLQYDGNWDPEPGGWRRLSAVLRNNLKIALQVQTTKLGDGSLISAQRPAEATTARPSDAEIRQMAVKRIPPADLLAAMTADPQKAEAMIRAKVAAVRAELDAADAARAAAGANFKLAHLTGTDALKLTDAQRQELKKFVDAGGTLIIDAAGGSTQFAASAEQMLTDTFGPDASQLNEPLAPEAPLYQQPGRIADAVQYRQFARTRISSTRMPRLRGINIGGRLAIVFSREDLSAGLVGEPVDGITGYTPASATELMTDIILAATSAAPAQPPTAAAAAR